MDEVNWDSLAYIVIPSTFIVDGDRRFVNGIPTVPRNTSSVILVVNREGGFAMPRD